VTTNTGLILADAALALGLRLEHAGHMLTVADGLLHITNGAQLTAEDRAQIAKWRWQLLAIVGGETWTSQDEPIASEARSLSIAQSIALNTPTRNDSSTATSSRSASIRSSRKQKQASPKQRNAFAWDQEAAR
jgi:hypothetical protein